MAKKPARDEGITKVSVYDSDLDRVNNLRVEVTSKIGKMAGQFDVIRYLLEFHETYKDVVQAKP